MNYMQQETNTSFKLFPFLMAVLLLFAIGVESTYAMSVDNTALVKENVSKEDADNQDHQQKTMIDILNDHQDALPHSNEKMHWCNVFVKSLPAKDNFRFIVKPIDTELTVTNNNALQISIQQTCINTHYSAPNAP